MSSSLSVLVRSSAVGSTAVRLPTLAGGGSIVPPWLGVRARLGDAVAACRGERRSIAWLSSSEESRAGERRGSVAGRSGMGGSMRRAPAPPPALEEEKDHPQEEPTLADQQGERRGSVAGRSSRDPPGCAGDQGEGGRGGGRVGGSGGGSIAQGGAEGGSRGEIRGDRRGDRRRFGGRFGRFGAALSAVSSGPKLPVRTTRNGENGAARSGEGGTPARSGEGGTCGDGWRAIATAHSASARCSPRWGAGDGPRECGWGGVGWRSMAIWCIVAGGAPAASM